MDLFATLPLQLRILMHVALAMMLGAAIGLEREMADKPAGLRTHMLVTGAAAFFVAMGDALVQHYINVLGPEVLRSDPLRLLEAVVTGVSFLGAGTIIRLRDSAQGVEGLTTAASMLFAAAVGVAVALSQIILATGLTLLVLFTLRVLFRFERWMKERRRGSSPGKE